MDQQSDLVRAEHENIVAEVRAARARGDEEAWRDAIRRISEHNRKHPKPPPPPPRSHVSRDLKDARRRQDPQDARAVVGDAFQQEQCHLLDADDLIWLVERLGTFESSWSAGQAIAAWLYHHGPIHPALVEVAESIAGYDDARWLDDVLLWIEPTPDRWHQHARWRVRFVWEDTAELLAAAGREPPVDLRGSATVEVFKQQAVGTYAEHARRVVAERGDAARRSLRASRAEAKPRSGVVLVLEAWADVLG